MRVLLLYPELDLERKAGVERKLWGQFNAFKKKGFLVNAIFCKEQEIWIIEGSSGDLISRDQPKNWLLIALKYFLIAQKELRRTKPDIVYIRYPFSQPFFLWFLYNAKKYHLKVLLEFATFPYDQEFKNRSLLKKSVLLVDKLFRNYLKNFVEKTITYTEHQSIYGIKTIKIENGIDVSFIRKKQLCSDSNQLNLIGVANLAIWHGYDRVIKGISEYYKSKNPLDIDVHFSIIGDGPARKDLEKLVISLNLIAKVVFKGQLAGPDLEFEFDNSHIGIEVIGMHRRGLNEASSIKAREYCIKGLPFISSVTDKDFINSEFVMKIPANDDPVIIWDIIEFYEHLKGSDYSLKMNEYAIKNLSWDVKLKPVFECLKEKI
jgi:hypothetical protein